MPHAVPGYVRVRQRRAEGIAMSISTRQEHTVTVTCDNKPCEGSAPIQGIHQGVCNFGRVGRWMGERTRAGVALPAMLRRLFV